MSTLTVHPRRFDVVQRGSTACLDEIRVHETLLTPARQFFGPRSNRTLSRFTLPLAPRRWPGGSGAPGSGRRARGRWPAKPGRPPAPRAPPLGAVAEGAAEAEVGHVGDPAAILGRPEEVDVIPRRRFSHRGSILPRSRTPSPIRPAMLCAAATPVNADRHRPVPAARFPPKIRWVQGGSSL
jgi:hypothetical protein